MEWLEGMEGKEEVGRIGGVGWKRGIGRNGAIGKNERVEKRRGWVNGGIGKKIRGWNGRRRPRKGEIERKEWEELGKGR